MLVVRGDGVDQRSAAVNLKALWKFDGAVAILSCGYGCVLDDGKVSAGGGFQGKEAAGRVELGFAVGGTRIQKSQAAWETASIGYMTCKHLQSAERRVGGFRRNEDYS